MESNFATIYEQDLEYISRCILDYPDIETGGDFFGFWNNLGLPVVIYVTGPGENCYRHSTFFKQDLIFLQEIGNVVFSKYGLQQIGSWHSHHKLNLSLPSNYDCNTMSLCIKNNDLENFFMILGNITNDSNTIINGFLFNKINKVNYIETNWKILKNKNIISELIEKELNDNLIYKPKTLKPKLYGLKLHSNFFSKTQVLKYDSNSWLGSNKGKIELKNIYNWISNKYTNVKMYVNSFNDLEIIFDVGCILFKNDFPNSYPQIIIGKTNLSDEVGFFEYNNFEDILNYLKSKIEFK